MITPMVKYTFLVLKSRREALLARLGELGVVDVTVGDWQPDGEGRRLMDKIAAYDTALTKLKSVAESNKKEKRLGEVLPYDTAQKALEVFTEQSAHMTKAEAELAKVRKERDDVAVWGRFDADMLDRLGSEGVKVRFFVCERKRFKSEWQESGAVVVDDDGRTVRFVAVSCGDGETFDGAVEVARPVSDVAGLDVRIEGLEGELDMSRRELARAAASAHLLKEAREDAGMELLHLKAVSAAEDAVEGSVTVISGWVPRPRRSEVDEAFADSGAVVFAEKPSLEDNPPILLKNNRFARLCEMVGELYSMPSYRELDLTPFFAPFFILFVGVCFGDLGYAIITFVAAAVAFFVLRKNDFAKRVSGLVMWCSVAAMLIGLLTGTFFGMELKTFKVFEGFPFLGQMDMFTFALAVGVVQIVYALFVQAYARAKYMGFRYAVATLGWAMTIVVSVLAYLLPEAGVDFGFDSPWYIGAVSLFLGMNIFYNNPDKNVFVNLGGGLWGIYNNVTGLLGDVLSYIRLFALGLSSGIIAGVFNDLAVSMSGDIPVVSQVIMVLILLVGHGINLFMSAISSFVHPLRLTFVEFYKNAGFEGGGRKYEPYKTRKD